MSLLPLLALLMQTSDLTLAPLFTDGCVLQREAPVRIWGKASPGQTVEVGIDSEQVVVCLAQDTGDWEAYLPPHSAGGAHTLHIRGDRSLTLKDVVFGEVWICSGQSNMEWSLQLAAEGPAEIPVSSNRDIRMFNVARATADEPAETIAPGKWMEAGPKTSGEFSAVGYFFAKELHKQLGVPVGMIHTSWGGTRIEAWTSKHANLAQGVAEKEFLSREKLAETDPFVRRQLERWTAAGSPVGEFLDPGRKPETKGWELDRSDAHWVTTNAPGEWTSLGLEELQSIDGGVWFRKTITVPPEWIRKSATLHLGPIDDFDTTFFNGVKVGGIARETPNWWSHPRVYKLPTLKYSDNLISVRIWDLGAAGGFVGTEDQLYLECETGERISLAGAWDFRIENVRPEPFGEDPNTASTLYNAMLNPLRKYTVKGAIWYQGESNADHPKAYRSKLPAMVEDWRKTFENPDLSFYAVQLAPFEHDGSRNTAYAQLREAQSMLRDRIANADSVVITDVGDERDIHPSHKGPVGKRLALLAANRTYKLQVAAFSPRIKDVVVEGDRAMVEFDHAGEGLEIRGGKSSGKSVPSDRLVGFQIAGADRKFVDADARIVGKDRVEVRSAAVPDPKYVRFGFLNFPLVNLWSKDGLPAEPFRSDRD